MLLSIKIIGVPIFEPSAIRLGLDLDRLESGADVTLYDIVPVSQYKARAFCHAVEDISRFCAANDAVTNQAGRFARCNSQILEATDRPRLSQPLLNVGWSSAHYRPE
jgi:hypothetical protein